MSQLTERWVSSREIAVHLGVNKDTLQRWINNKTIPCHRVGRLWKFKISEVDAWVQIGESAFADNKMEEVNMINFGDAERKIVSLLQNGQTFVFEGECYTVAKVGKPTCKKGEPKTDVYVLAKSEKNEKEFKISFKKDNADFIENKTSAERAEALFGDEWQNIIINATTTISDSFINKPLIYKVKSGKTDAGAITLGWKYEILNKTGGELSGVVSLTNDQIIDIYAGTHLPTDKKHSMVNGEVIIDCGIANYILMNSNISTSQQVIDNLQTIESYVEDYPTVYFACKALNYRTFLNKYDGDRPLSVYVEWDVINDKLNPNLVFNNPLKMKGNEVANRLKNSLAALNIRNTDDISDDNITIPSKIKK